MYKVIKIYTHGVHEVTGTAIFALASFNTSKTDESLVALFLFNETGRLEKSHSGKN